MTRSPRMASGITSVSDRNQSISTYLLPWSLGRTRHSMSNLVSIVVPTYNRAHLIPLCIASVLQQTYTNYEVIIVDDHSTDDTDRVVREFLGDPRIQFHRLESNSGPAIARNRGIAHAKGEFIAFLDSDDLWFPEKLATQMRLIEAETLDWTASQIEDANIDTNAVVIRGNFRPNSDYLLQLLSSNCSIPMSTIIVKKSLLISLGIFDDVRGGTDKKYPKSLYGAEHFELLLKMASSNYKFLFYEKPLARYVNHGDNISLILNSYFAYTRFILRSSRLFAIRQRVLLSWFAGVYAMKFVFVDVRQRLRRLCSGATQRTRRAP